MYQEYNQVKFLFSTHNYWTPKDAGKYNQSGENLINTDAEIYTLQDY